MLISFEPGLRPVLKHAQHDQKTHGRRKGTLRNNGGEPMDPETAWVHETTWYHGTSRAGLSTIDARNAPSRYPGMGRSYSVSAHNFATNDRALAEQYAREAADMDRERGVEGARPVVYEVRPTSDYFDPDPHSGPLGWNDGPEDMETVRDLIDNGGWASVRFHDEMDVVSSWDVDTGEMLKHGSHDQSSHGNWAKGRAGSGTLTREQRIAEAAKTGAPTGITPEDLPDLHARPSDFGIVYDPAADDPDEFSMGMMPDEFSVISRKVRSVEDGFLKREGKAKAAQERLDEMSPEELDGRTQMLEMLRDDGVVMVAMPEGALLATLEEGRIKTLFETNRSNGAVAYEARRSEEFANHDLHPGLDESIRPVYGYVTLPDTPTPNGVASYGEFSVELKPGVRDRTTMTNGDSLGSYATPVPMTGPRLTPLQVAGAEAWFPVSNSSEFELMADPSNGYTPESVYKAGTKLRYVEAQIVGGVRISDIARIHVRHDMTPGMKALADSLGIEVVFG